VAVTSIGLMQYQRVRHVQPSLCRPVDQALLMAAACVLTATKVNDTPFELRHVVPLYLSLAVATPAAKAAAAAAAGARGGATGGAAAKSKAVVEAEEAIARAERRALDATGFDFDFVTPWPLLHALATGTSPPARRDELDLAKRITSECLRTALCVTATPQQIADVALWTAVNSRTPARVAALEGQLTTPAPTLRLLNAQYLAHAASVKALKTALASGDHAAGAGGAGGGGAAAT
jgi:hypothetical protein